MTIEPFEHIGGYDEVRETQWRVVWFPPDFAYRTFVGAEATVRKTAETQAQWNPIVETREILRQPWEEPAFPEPLPRFVSLAGSTTMLLTHPSGRYWRPNGLWGVGSKYLDGVLVSDYPEMKSVHEKPLIEITAAEFRRDNGGPLPTTWVDNG